MKPGDWIALVSALVAASAMFVAIWQAFVAKGSREAAKRQADAAEGSLTEAKEQTAAARASAEAAQRAVYAAEVQAEEARHANDLAREALDHEQAARDARDEPQLAVKPARRTKKSAGRGIAVTLTEGSPVNVTLCEVRPSGSAADLAVEISDGEAGPERLVKGVQAIFAIQLGSLTQRTQIELRFQCEEIDGEREWTKWETVTFPPPARVIAV